MAERHRFRDGGTPISVQVSPRAARDTPSPRSGGVGESISSVFRLCDDEEPHNTARRPDLAATRWRTPCYGRAMQLFAVYAHPIPKPGLRAE
jgi:hypothetical protein